MAIDLVNELALRADGPVSFRLVLQPAIAVLFAVRDGLADARSHRTPYLAALAGHKDLRQEQISGAWASVGKVFIFAFLLDLIYQFQTAEQNDFAFAAIVAIILCAVPYTLVRGPVARIAA